VPGSTRVTFPGTVRFAAGATLANVPIVVPSPGRLRLGEFRCTPLFLCDVGYHPLHIILVATRPQVGGSDSKGLGMLLGILHFKGPSTMATSKKFSNQLKAFCDQACHLADLHNADAILFLMEKLTDWRQLRRATKGYAVLVAGDSEETLYGASEEDFDTIQLNMSSDAPVYERLTQALLEGVADELLPAAASVVAVYSGFEDRAIDSLSIIRLGEHLGQLTVRDLRQLETRVPINTLKTVVDLAVQIGREGREGKPVGTLFTVGDHRKVLANCHSMGFDPMRGYNRVERSLNDTKVREGVKEIAQMDGAFVVSADATIIAAAQHISASGSSNISLSKGLGSRHWAAAEITHATSAIAVTVSASNGTVRIFQKGEVMLRIEPFRRAMKWKEFEYETPTGSSE
jgi:diadenylate cyclase